MQPVTAAPPPPSLRGRLLRALQADPWGPFVRPLARMVDVAEAAAEALLARIDDPDAWEPLGPYIALQHLPGGPATADADVGFVRVADGVRFPLHSHAGVERTLVLRGVLVEEADGRRYPAGSRIDLEPGVTHAFRAEGELIYAVVVWDVSFLEAPPGT